MVFRKAPFEAAGSLHYILERSAGNLGETLGG
jgi:hypothetical protein